jgi:Domain of unknown function (DUF4412)
MRRKWMVMAAVLAAAGGWLAEASGGWLIDQTLKGGGQVARQQVVLQGNRMKSVMLAPDGRPGAAFILDLDADIVTQVNYEARQYVSVTVAEYTRWFAEATQAAASQAAAAMKQMQEAMKTMPPEQRKAMEQQMRAQMPPGECVAPKMETRKTGQQATIGGFPAARYEILADGKPESEIWLAPGLPAWRELDLGKLERFTAAMAKVMPACGGGQRRPGFSAADPSWKLASEGYPVRIVSEGTTVEVVKADSRSVPAAEFQPPAGFARKSLREALGP